MRICPNCGHENEETATVCVQCNQALPLPAVPTQPPTAAPVPQAPIPLAAAQAQDTRQKRRQYFLGLGLGLIPLVIFLFAIGFSFHANLGSTALNVAIYLLLATLVLYVAALIAMIVFLSMRNVRFVGYGLLTAVLASPIIGGIACVVSLNIH